MPPALRFLACLLFAAAAETPAWVAKVPDFRSAWPEPHPAGAAAPDFALPDVASGRTVCLSKFREGRKATVVLFVDDHCATCRQRGTDLAASLARVGEIEAAGALVVFTRNLSGGGAKSAREFAEQAKFPDVPLLFDGKDDRAGTTIAWRVMVTPCAAVLDAEGRFAYFGLALEPKGSDLLPAAAAAVAGGGPLPGPAFRPPYG